MKFFLNILFGIYDLFSSPLPSCRFTPTCSRYTREAIEKYGFTKGTLMAATRIAACHPFSTRPFYDPV